MINQEVAARGIFITEDGSTSFKLSNFNEQFHSLHGAIAESEHIYIKEGLQALPLSEEPIHLLEVGFGTGLNALLTIQNAHPRTIYYHAIEPFPLTEAELQQLNYVERINPLLQDDFLQIHQAPEDTWMNLSSSFFFKKTTAFLEDILLPEAHYNLVYFDAFSPETQPHLWTQHIFEKLYQAMKPKAVLVTYCAKGKVKRDMKSAGFSLFSLPGPKGKREITRCVK
jgi:tRNA U34 5-methylaminomethyl-2-thiouridine-forming methyltransferase MnmC